MPRARSGAARHRAKKRLLRAAKGYRGSHSKLFRSARLTLQRAQAMSYVGRKLKKRDFRSLWISRRRQKRRQRARPTMLSTHIRPLGHRLNRPSQYRLTLPGRHIRKIAYVKFLPLLSVQPELMAGLTRPNPLPQLQNHRRSF